jgi:glycosyltransferase involved in cell wall biosynthesis
MTTLSVLLTTVRGYGAYTEHPEWHAIGKVVEDLSVQTYKDFELIVVDGLFAQQRDYVAELSRRVSFQIVHIPPWADIWTTNRKVAICAYRNTGIAAAKGELIVNLDDCCALPPEYLSVFAHGWKLGICAALTWPKRLDWRRPQIVDRPGMVFGFGSYSRSAALELNGYDCAFDGSQALEDADWSTRLFNLGVKTALVEIPGFDILPQSGHSPDAIDLKEPIVKCCNAAWQTQRVWRQVRRANVAEVYTPEALERLVPGPCRYRAADICLHHRMPCAYLGKSWLDKRHELVEQWMKNPPTFDLKRRSL